MECCQSVILFCVFPLLQSLALIENDTDIKIAVLRVLQLFSSNSSEFNWQYLQMM